MIQKLNDKNSLWLLGFCSAAILLLLYHDLILNPATTILNNGEDGFKNYFVFLYHIIHDPDYWHFEGMNYPYGEFLLYTDSQPILSNILKLCGADIPTSIVVMHFCIWISLVLLPVYTFKLLRSFEVNIHASILFALAAFMLNPQIYRLGGHYGLAYAFFIPAVWYHTRLFLSNSDKWRNGIIIFLLISVSLLLHVYLGLLCAALILIWLILITNLRNLRALNFSLFLLAILPVALLFITSKSLDEHLERTSRPYGIYEYNSTPLSIFVPHHGPIAKFITKSTGLVNEKWEGWAYPGFAVIIFILIYLFYLIRNRKIDYESDKTKLLIFGIIFLIIAMALPFRSIGQYLLDVFPPFRQFRSLGRFAWLSFYAFIILSAILASDYWKNKSKRILIILAIFSLCLEGYWQHKATKGILGGSAEKLVAANTIKKPQSYQAILPLPWFHMGSDNLIILGDPAHNAEAMSISLQSGIPLMAADESRISWVEARELSRIFSYEPGAKKPVLNLLNDSDILVYSHTQRTSMENYYWDAARNTDKPEFKILSPEVLKDFDGIFFNNVMDSSLVPETYPVLKSDNEHGFWFFNDFEDNSSEMPVISGNGAYSEQRFRHKKIASFDPGTFIQNQRYELSFWAWTGAEDYIGEMIVIEEHHPQSGYKEWRYVSELNSSLIMEGDWTLGVLEFDVQRPESIVSVMLRGSAADRRLCVIDQLLIRDLNSNIYSIDPKKGRGYWNNRWYPLP